MQKSDSVHVIGGGLAGSEAAFQAAEAGCQVTLHEMRPVRATEVHKTPDLAELVCSNSFRSDDVDYNAVGLLHEEMRRLSSLIMACADAHKVPAGSALAVDRNGFSAAVTAAIEAHPRIDIVREEIGGLPPADWGNVIIATGPLTAAPLAADPRPEVEAALRRYGDALESGDIARVKRAYPALSAEQEDGLAAFYSSGGTLTTDWTFRDLLIAGDTATARIVGANRVTAPRARATEQPVYLRVKLVRQSGGWRLVQVIN
mgnify:CR=1 FL=1